MSQQQCNMQHKVAVQKFHIQKLKGFPNIQTPSSWLVPSGWHAQKVACGGNSGKKGKTVLACRVNLQSFWKEGRKVNLLWVGSVLRRRDSQIHNPLVVPTGLDLHLLCYGAVCHLFLALEHMTALPSRALCLCGCEAASFFLLFPHC